MQRMQAAHPRARVGDAEDLEQLLRGAVLAARAVQGDEGDLGPLLLQPPHQVGAGVERHHLVAERLERVLDPAPRSAARPGAPATCPPSAPPPSSAELGLLAPRGAAGPRPLALARAPRCRAPVREPAPAGKRCSPVIVSYSATCSLTTLPIRRIPSRIWSSSKPEKLSRIELRPPPPVDVGGGAGDEGDVLAQRLGEQVGGVDVGGQGGPDEHAALRPGPGGLLGEVALERLEHRVAPRPVDRRRGCRRSSASGPRRSTRARSTGRGSRCRGRWPACRAPSSPSRAAAPPPSPAGSRARGSSTACRCRSRSRRRRGGRAAAGARPRSAAGRRGCPRPPAPRARAPARPGGGGARPTGVTPAGFWKVGTE